jgi:hypothetical protein
LASTCGGNKFLAKSQSYCHNGSSLFRALAANGEHLCSPAPRTSTVDLTLAQHSEHKSVAPMDKWSLLFVLILFGIAFLLILEVRPYEWRKSEPEDLDREAQRAQLKEVHRMRRQRDRVWFKIDNLYAEFVTKTSSEKLALEDKRTDPSAHAGDGAAAADNWNDVTLTYIKEKYESFLKKD